jgi:hypothetical protein
LVKDLLKEVERESFDISRANNLKLHDDIRPLLIRYLHPTLAMAAANQYRAPGIDIA